MQKLQNLLDKTFSIVYKNNQLLDATGGRFNLFQVIGVTTAETRLHSAFLTELLDTKGSHGLKDKPLKSFVKHCLADEFDFQTTSARSKAEHYIGVKTKTTGGQIDIIVWDNLNRAIIIENKINACDQELQMLRYFNHSKAYANSRLIYLSLDGKLPSEFSTGCELFDYKTLSYKFDIINWLTECKQLAVDFPLVREAISHYINLIKQLTNTSSMDEMNKEIVALVMQSPENMQNAFEIEKTITDVKIKMQWEFWKQLEISLKDKHLNVKGDDDSKKVKRWKVEGYYEKQRNRNIHYGLWVEIYNQDGITLHWGCEIQENIYCGFTLEKNGKGGISNNEEFRLYQQIITDCDVRYQTTDHWLGRQHTTPILNFKAFNDKEIFKLADKLHLEKVTNQIAEKAVGDITFVINQLKELIKSIKLGNLQSRELIIPETRIDVIGK
jgi:hypothetical protein